MTGLRPFWFRRSNLGTIVQKKGRESYEWLTSTCGIFGPQYGAIDPFGQFGIHHWSRQKLPSILDDMVRKSFHITPFYEDISSLSRRKQTKIIGLPLSASVKKRMSPQHIETCVHHPYHHPHVRACQAPKRPQINIKLTVEFYSH